MVLFHNNYSFFLIKKNALFSNKNNIEILVKYQQQKWFFKRLPLSLIPYRWLKVDIKVEVLYRFNFQKQNSYQKKG